MNEWITERFLGRTAPADKDSLDDISWLVRAMQSAYPEATVDEATASAHVSAMLAAHLTAESGDPAAKSVSKAHGPASQVSGLPKLRRKPVRSNPFGSLVARIATGAVAALTAFSGMAVAGVLPDPTQSAAATLASHVGLDTEDPDEQGTEQGTDILGDEDAAKLDEDEDGEEVEAEEDDETDDDLDGKDSAATDDADDTVGAADADTADSIDTVSEDADSAASAPSAPSADTADDDGDVSVEDEPNESEDDNAADDADSADEPDSEDE